RYTGRRVRTGPAVACPCRRSGSAARSRCDPAPELVGAECRAAVMLITSRAWVGLAVPSQKASSRHRVRSSNPDDRVSPANAEALERAGAGVPDVAGPTNL